MVNLIKMLRDKRGEDSKRKNVKRYIETNGETRYLSLFTKDSMLVVLEDKSPETYVLKELKKIGEVGDRSIYLTEGLDVLIGKEHDLSAYDTSEKRYRGDILISKAIPLDQLYRDNAVYVLGVAVVDKLLDIDDIRGYQE